MLTRIPEGLRRSLLDLRSRGESLSLADLARHLLALDRPAPPALARRIVAAALDHDPAQLPERLAVPELRSGEEAAVAQIPLEHAEFVVVDLETTGLSTERCTILEIGAVRVSRLECRTRFQTLVRPPGRVPRAIVDLTGIDDVAVAEAPPPRIALRAFRSWLSRSGGAPFVAHNAAFDARFVRRALEALRLPDYCVPVLCTRRLARRLLPELRRYDLDSLCAHFGIPNGARHRALGDAEATARALVELLHRACAEGRRTLGDLLDLQERPPPRRRRRRR